MLLGIGSQQSATVMIFLPTGDYLAINYDSNYPRCYIYYVAIPQRSLNGFRYRASARTGAKAPLPAVHQLLLRAVA
jgi:hypothetical protein